MFSRICRGGQKVNNACRLLFPGVLFLILGASLTGCQDSGEAEQDVEISWQIEPEIPRVGTTTINITLRDSSETLVEGASISLEGNMSHPGMQPVLSTADEVEPGRYAAPFEFTMAGDWFIIIRATLPDSSLVEQQINFPGVRSQ